MATAALISDLMMASQVAAAATRCRVDLAITSSVEALLAKVAANRPALVIIDLTHPRLDVEQLIDRLKPILPEGAKILAFGPHVHKDRLAAANAAGCDRVISRGQFHAEVESILAEAAG